MTRAKDDPAFALFRADVEANGGALRAGLIDLHADPSARWMMPGLAEAIEVIGSGASILGLDAPLRIARAISRCFKEAREGRADLDASSVGRLLEGVAMLERLATEDVPAPELNALQKILDALPNTNPTTSATPNVPVPVPVPVPAPPLSPSPSPPPKESLPAPSVPTKTVAAVPPRRSSIPPAADLSGFSMLDLFRIEVETQVAVLNDGLLALESEASGAEALEALMRAAHSIKGAARVVQLDAAVHLAHAMEDIFVAAQKGKVKLASDDVDRLLAGADTFVRMAKVDADTIADWLETEHATIAATTAEITSLLGPPDGHAERAAPPGKAAAPRPAPRPSERAPPLVRAESTPPSDLRAPAIEPAAAAPRTSQEPDRLLRVTADNLNRMMALVGESVVETRWLEPFGASLDLLKRRQMDLADQLERVRAAVTERAPEAELEELLQSVQSRATECEQILADRRHELETYSRRSANLSERLYREVIASRMRPFADGTVAFPRMVRDVARRLGKKVRFEVEGQRTEVDREILEKLDAPMTHMVRNAIDHGIEMPDVRLAAGKREEGTVRLEARHQAGRLVVEVTDDGRGVHLDALKKKITERRLATPGMIAAMGEAELLSFLFLPGFSTAEALTEISGRGVGLDIVQAMVQAVGGTIIAETRPGHGLTIRLELPLTRSVLRTLIVEIAGEPYAFPLSRIERTLRLPRAQVESIEGREYFTFEGDNIGLVAAHQVLERAVPEAAATDIEIVVISDHLKRFGLVVDKLLGERDLVVQVLDPRLGKIPDVAAAALLQDGTPVLILDVEDMVRSIDNLLSGGRLRKLQRGTTVASAKKRVLVVDDSLTVRETQRRLLESRGYLVEVAVDGMDGWNAIRTAEYDLVISDVDMPRMTGIDLVTRIKADPAVRKVPVIIVSYKDREEDRLRGLQAGADYYLTKSSFHDETFARAVADLIGAGGA